MCDCQGYRSSAVARRPQHEDMLRSMGIGRLTLRPRASRAATARPGRGSQNSAEPGQSSWWRSSTGIRTGTIRTCRCPGWPRTRTLCAGPGLSSLILSTPNASEMIRSSTHLPGRTPNGRRSTSSAQLTISIPFSSASSASLRINGPKSPASHERTAAGVPSSVFSRFSIFRYMSTMLTTTRRVCPFRASASRRKFSSWNAGEVSPLKTIGS